MVNIPPNLQRVWNDVSKDGKIDKADVEKLIKEAAPSLGKPGQMSLESVDSEIDTQEREFLANFTGIKEGSSVEVKNGTAKGTFDFVDGNPSAVKFPSKEAPKTETAKTNPYFEPITLDNKTTTPVQNNQDDSKQLEDLKKLKASLPATLKGDELTQEISKIDKKISDLETKIAANSPKPVEAKSETNTTQSNDADLKTLEDLKKLKTSLPATLKGDELTTKTAELDKKIADLEAKIAKNNPKPAEVVQPSTPAPPQNNTDNLKKLEDLKKLKAELPKTLSGEELTKQMAIVDKGIADLEAKIAETTQTPKQKLFSEINGFIKAAVTESLKTGDMSKFTVARREIEKLIDKNPELGTDPEILKIKAILTGASTDEPNNYVTKAIKTIEGTNKLVEKSNWTKADYSNAKALVDDPAFSTDGSQLKDAFKGPLRDKLDAKISSYENKMATEKEANKKSSIDGIRDTIGRGFLNATNKEGTAAIFQSLAVKGELDETLKRMKAADQIRVMKLLAESGDKFNLEISRKIYDNLSKIANVDDELGKDLTSKIKDVKLAEPSKENPNENIFAKNEVDSKAFVSGLKHSMYSEKDAALTMTRSILNGPVSSEVLNKFNSEELDVLVKLVGDKGHKGEKEELLSVIAGNYAKGSAPNVDFMKKSDKANIMKSFLEDSHIDDSRLDELIKKSGKKVVFDVVNNNNLNDSQLARLGKYADGDQMADEPVVAKKMLVAMIKTFNKDPNSVSISDINKFIDQIDKDWTKDDDVMKMVIRELGDGPDSEYAKFSQSASESMDRIRRIAK